MNSDIMEFPPPADSTAFESLCLDLWKDIWCDSSAQKNGRRGQNQDGIDIFGQHEGNWVGVQCKQKDGLLWKAVKPEELETEVKAALRFKPALTGFILATTGPREKNVQERARELTDAHKSKKLFTVEVWSWREIWPELCRRQSLLKRIRAQYWPQICANPISNLHQLPSLPADFIGRETELAELEGQFNAASLRKADTTNKHIGLHGMPGVGKSALATVLAYRLRERFPDAQLYLNLHGAEIGQEPISAREAMERIIRSFDLGQDLQKFTVEEVENFYRSTLHNSGRVLILLDNAAGADQIRALLPPPNCLLLVTSQRGLFMDELAEYKLGCLSPTQSQDLLVKTAPRIKGYEQKAAELCGHLPLALKVIGGSLRESSLVTPRELIDSFGYERNKFTAVNAAFQASCQFLDVRLRKQWFQLADFRSSFDLRAADAVWEVATIFDRQEGEAVVLEAEPKPEEEARNSLQILVNANLVEWNQNTNRFHLHSLARQFCAAQTRQAELIAFASGVHADLAPLRRRLEAAIQIEDDRKMIAELETILREFPAIAEEVLKNHNGAKALEKITGRAFFTGMIAAPQERIHHAEQKLASAQKNSDRKGEGRALFDMAVTYSLNNDYSQAIAYAERALPMLEEFKDPLLPKLQEKVALWQSHAIDKRIQ